MSTSRRSFLQLVGSGAFGATFASTIRRALAIPAHHRTGTIEDVEHIVILMQENRSFDHYFGTLRGVRGYGDPRAVRLPSGDSVFAQPNGPGKVLPFHPDAPDLGLQFLVDLPHGWEDTHAAWNRGKYDQWIPNKSEIAMAYLTRQDIPYHYALADAFTVCDAYYCSLLGPTDPNRYHMWTGWTGNDGKNGGPVLNNAEAGSDWSTYPERLTAAGVSWKIYQDAGAGLDADHYWGWGDDAFIGNYGDNSLLYFHQYQNAQPGSPLYVGARTATDISHQGGTLCDLFQKDVAAGTLPQISWIVAPEAYTEHGNWPANYGAWYVSHFLDALTSNPEVWSKTAFFLCYDENDGLFDHMVPPTPPQSRAEGLSTVDTTNEVFAGNADFSAGPYGMGVRVPMLVISPWSKGGWVNSEVFDHTSLIQFIEQRFHHVPALRESNITRWRRAVAGDLTSAFNFRSPNDAIVPLPPTSAYVPSDYVRHPDYIPDVPIDQELPKQEPGVRPARAVPYELSVEADVDVGARKITLRFRNEGSAAAVLQVRSGSNQDGPWTYTVGAHAKLSETWTYSDEDAYDLAIYGPNGFLRSVKGSFAGEARANLAVRASYDLNHLRLRLEVRNVSGTPYKVRVFDHYTGQPAARFLAPGERFEHEYPADASFGWYDLTVSADGDSAFQQRIAGHLETGCDSMTDPALGAH
jgi:phospholipase C